MKIAIATEQGRVSAHFGRCPGFTIVEKGDNSAAETSFVANPGHQPGAIPEFLSGMGVECIVAGGMGQRAQALFSEYGVKTVLGVEGSVAALLEALADGTLQGGESSCSPGAGKGYGLDKTSCDHEETQ